MTLEEILQKYFGCKKPFLKRPKSYYDGETRKKDYFTERGYKAYEQLISLIGDLGTLVENEHEAGQWVETLDDIASREDY